MTDVLAAWNDGAARQAVVEFVERTVSDGVPAEERVAVFDNDGTLWCEKPMPIQADFILRRLSEMAQADPGLRGRQPWKAAYEQDYGWLGTVITEHYAGNDANVGTLLAGILAAYDGISVEEFSPLPLASVVVGGRPAPRAVSSPNTTASSSTAPTKTKPLRVHKNRERGSCSTSSQPPTRTSEPCTNTRTSKPSATEPPDEGHRAGVAQQIGEHMLVLSLVLIGLAITLEPIPLTAFILVLASKGGVRKGAAFIFGWLLSLA
ncbi:MAG TPA: hypothetical protein VMI33_18560, partial [Streptosporangiaceae bacterium]|nr:hypothetical protein [Streptosporangiaceae bacterium]